MTWLGLDIGGANLKAADGRGWAKCVPFALWRDPGGLAGAAAKLLESAPAAERLAVTMTGELCDCFRTKAEGVRHILASVEEAAAGRDVRVYLVDGRFVSIDAACKAAQRAAASNWHALASFAGRFAPRGTGLLVDIGSTTTDIVPLVDGVPRPRGVTDTDRLVHGELVYSGVGRTPVCAVARSVPYRGVECPIAAELFATTADAYVILGDLPEQPAERGTADGRPLTKEFCRERLGRMIGADETQFSAADAERAAAAIRDGQLVAIRASVRRVAEGLPRAPDFTVLSGAGEFLGRLALGGILSDLKFVCLSQQIGPEASTAAPAHAVAVLAGEHEISV